MTQNCLAKQTAMTYNYYFNSMRCKEGNIEMIKKMTHIIPKMEYT